MNNDLIAAARELADNTQTLMVEGNWPATPCAVKNLVVMINRLVDALAEVEADLNYYRDIALVDLQDESNRFADQRDRAEAERDAALRAKRHIPVYEDTADLLEQRNTALRLLAERNELLGECVKTIVGYLDEYNEQGSIDCDGDGVMIPQCPLCFWGFRPDHHANDCLIRRVQVALGVGEGEVTK